MLKNGVSYQNESGTVAITSTLPTRSVTEIFKASGAIAVGDWVALDLTASLGAQSWTVKVATGGATGGPAIGVALEAVTSDEATAGAWVKVCIEGYCSAKIADLVTEGQELVQNNATAGVAVALTAAMVFGPCGLALTDGADSDAAVPVFVYRRY